MQLVLIFSFAGAAPSMNCGSGMPLPCAAKEKDYLSPTRLLIPGPSNKTAVDLENYLRRVQNPNGPTRTAHNP